MSRVIPLWKRFTSSSRTRILFFLGLFTAYLLVFTVILHMVYPVWEGEAISWEEAVLFVVETVTTVGYGDLLPFESEYTILFTIVMIISGVFLIFMFIPLLLAPALSEHIRASPPRRLPAPMENHVVIVGSGEGIRALIESLEIADLPLVIVEEDRSRAEDLLQRYRKQAAIIWGDFSDAETWRNASIADAGSVVVCAREGVAASVILGVRGMTKARIIAVVDNLGYDRYLRYAGAEYVLSPKTVAGRILGRHAITGSPGETILGISRTAAETESGLSLLSLVSVPVMAGSRAVGRTFADLALPERYGISVLFFWKGGSFDRFPRGEDRIDASTMLFLLGREEDINRAFREEIAGEAQENEIAVIAGYGDVGRAAYRELRNAGVECTVIDRQDHRVNVIGEAEDEEALRAARIEEATTCIVALNDDNATVFTTLMARNLNPDLRILARANSHAAVDKLYLAGADYVSLLPTIGGQSIADIILAGIVRVLLDLPDGGRVVMRRALKRSEVRVKTVERRCGVRIAGIEGEGRALVGPAPDETVMQGDAVIAVGDPAAIRRFIRFI
ncbi:potassium channel family protein [Methanofollis fontis]|uniref:Potassium transporter TrkA n=1 Tax=Methanofollis fontis TaxID=2052832 RepID=A0A483CW88_9EURY|nr:NAD-binding protein [Methanofollis fontis]TAJ45821.1 potassium transporter TrkA [Methanofollis fontis]